MSFPPYEPAYSCNSAGPGATNLMYWFDKESPWASTITNLGVCNCRLPSLHSECRAADLGVPVVSGGHPVGWAVQKFLTANASKLGVIEIIFAKTRWSAAHPGGYPYTGVSPHWDHVHVAISRNSARYLTVPTIRSVYAGSFPAPAPTPAPAPAPTPTPTPVPDPEDEEMAVTIRLAVAGHKHNGRVEKTTEMHRRWIPADELKLYSFLGGKIITCTTAAQFNAWTANKAAIGSNGINGPI